MKKTLIAAIVCAMTLPAMAQSEIFDTPGNAPYFGVRLSYDLTAPTNYNFNHSAGYAKVMDSGSGFAVGGIYNLPIFKNCFFEPGVTLYYETAGVKDYLKAEMPFDDCSVREWGLRIPLMFGYRFDFGVCGVSIFTGPEFRLGLSGKLHYKKYIEHIDMSGSESMYDAYNRAGADWRIGVGCDFLTHWCVNVSGGIGMTDWAKDLPWLKGYPNGSLTRNNFMVTLGYNF